MKFVFLVEGQTEALGIPELFNKWLNAQFEEGIGVSKIAFSGWSELHDEAPARAYKYLTGSKSHEIIAVVSLLDLYGPSFYPKDAGTVAERYATGREHLVARVSDYFKEKNAEIFATRYRHFFAVHETEAWLLAQPSLFAPDIKARLDKIKKSPEQINFKEPPAKLLDRLYLEVRNRTYSKTVNGRNFFPKLDVENTMSVCPYFQAMLYELRELARLHGATPKGVWYRP